MQIPYNLARVSDILSVFAGATIQLSSNTSSDSSKEQAQLFGQIEMASAALQTQLDELRQHDTNHLHQDTLDQGGAKLLRLSDLRRQLAGGAKDVTALRASIMSAVADSRAYTSEVRNSATAAQGANTQTMTVALQQASASARTATAGFMHDYYDRRIFDPYLRFASVEDEEEYRRREEQWKQAIEKAQAEHTPEGDLRADRLAIEQLKDAGAHGAERSPDYKPKLKALTQKADALESVLHRNADGRETDARVQANAQQSAAPATVAPDVIAALQKAGVVTADPNADGHGVGNRPVIRSPGQTQIQR